MEYINIKVMKYKLTVFDSEAARKKYPEDAKRFDRSLKLLSDAGIKVNVVKCNNLSDLKEGEVKELVSEKGMSALPVTEFDGAVVSDGKYPSDQTLADYLDAPDGLLSANRTQAPNVNDLAPPCACGMKDDCK